MGYIHNRVLLSPKKRTKFVICNNLGRLGGHYASEIKSDRERQILNQLTYMWNLKNKTLVSIMKQKQTHRCREQASGYWWEKEGAG